MEITEGRAGRSEQGRAAGAVPAAVTFTLPVPPSTNALFRNLPGKGRVKTRAYADWRAYALTSLRQQRLPLVDGHIIVRMNVEMTGNRADLDNRVKAIFDVIVEARVIADDSLITAFLVAKLPPANGLAHIEIQPSRSLSVNFHPSHDGSRGGWFVPEPQPTEEAA